MPPTVFCLFLYNDVSTNLKLRLRLAFAKCPVLVLLSSLSFAKQKLLYHITGGIADIFSEIVFYPFTPEIAIDSIIYLWKKKNSNKVGSMESTLAAMING